jgi:excisionase family DNA binding protein
MEQTETNPVLMDGVLYTPEEICDLSGLTISRVYDLLRTRQLRGLKIGYQWRVTRGDYLNFIKTCREVSAREPSKS